ncbi:hypothetical protein [Saccharothrix longispora]|uniref:hypothetical protein n=1 Tax=Saccharothrix longispora TaxID=33920 RepID=UPI0028FDB08D|nr:hypothetical protein [Saccharothrix longispora]MBY8851626.1 hypothetical protein [Saccharothrix sp. MB29]MDU0288849.1 hypothetical protein [Saccharothrix longispora]
MTVTPSERPDDAGGRVRRLGRPPFTTTVAVAAFAVGCAGSAREPLTGLPVPDACPLAHRVPVPAEVRSPEPVAGRTLRAPPLAEEFTAVLDEPVLPRR